jgi:tetratricopeptide (TPR) repeat protein
MKRLSILIVILFIGLKSSAFTFYADSIKIQPVRIYSTLDSLRQQLEVATNDTIKADLYNRIAGQYLNYDKLDSKTKRSYQAQALNYTYSALHLYSSLGDTTGLLSCFNGLAKVYRSQKKYPQAKWFILQSNSLSRAKKDIPNIISSLFVLANIKMEIKDYSLAMRDLDEALKLSRTHHSAKDESNIQQGYVLLYTHLKNYTKADIASKRHDFIEDSLLRGEEKLVAQTQDSLLLKKKVSPLNKKLTRTSLSKRIASL